MSFTYKYPRPALTVDVILFLKKKDEFFVLLIERKNDPFKGEWAFPGGFVEMDEELEQAALRELEEETGVCNVSITQFATYGTLGRDPRGRTVSVIYSSEVSPSFEDKIVAGDDAAKVKWFSIKSRPKLAFDHAEILNDFLRKQ